MYTCTSYPSIVLNYYNLDGTWYHSLCQSSPCDDQICVSFLFTVGTPSQTFQTPSTSQSSLWIQHQSVEVLCELRAMRRLAIPRIKRTRFSLLFHSLDRTRKRNWSTQPLSPSRPWECGHSLETHPDVPLGSRKICADRMHRVLLIFNTKMSTTSGGGERRKLK